MSKVVLSLPSGMVKNSVVGALLSLACYIVLQFPVALLLHNEVLGEGALYPAVCVCAALAAFSGCAYSALRSGEGMVLSAASVVLVFLVLTVAVALCTNEVGTLGAGLTGVGAAMAVGGLAAALVCGAMGRKPSSRREKKRTKRRAR